MLSGGRLFLATAAGQFVATAPCTKHRLPLSAVPCFLNTIHLDDPNTESGLSEHSSCSTKMGKKKSFIDKRAAKTYTLVFRSTEEEDAEQADRVLVPADAQQGAAAAAAVIDREQPPIKDPRALYAHFFGGADDDEKVSSRRVEAGSAWCIARLVATAARNLPPPPCPESQSSETVLPASMPA